MQWEYRKINMNELPRKTDDIDLLEDAGADGWELVAINSLNIAYLKIAYLKIAYRKRPLAPGALPGARRKSEDHQNQR